MWKTRLAFLGHKELLPSVSRWLQPCISLFLQDEPPALSNCWSSRMGGAAYAPQEVIAQIAALPYETVFVACIALTPVASFLPESSLPKNGWLYFFREKNGTKGMAFHYAGAVSAEPEGMKVSDPGMELTVGRGYTLSPHMEADTAISAIPADVCADIKAQATCYGMMLLPASDNWQNYILLLSLPGHRFYIEQAQLEKQNFSRLFCD